MSRKIYHIEDRGHKYIFHWFTYMIAGLRGVGQDTFRTGPGGGGSFEQNADSCIDNDDQKINITFPYIENMLDYQIQTMNLLKNFDLIKSESIEKDDVVINNYGERIVDNPYHIHESGYSFLRSIFLDYVASEDSTYRNKSYFISRSRSHLLEGNQGIKRRQIINEEEVLNQISCFEIEPIYLEDLDIKEKILLFRDAKVIISPNSGGLIFSLASNSSQTLLEINSSNPHQISRQYRDQCSFTGMKYERFSSTNHDHLDNMSIDINDFKKFIECKL